MKILTSPAKLMSIKKENPFLRKSTPIFINESKLIHKHLKQKSPKFLQELMNISPKLADENWDRNQKWTVHPKSNESCCALYAFDGEVYRGLDALNLSREAVTYLKKHYRILSGLYGLLKPSDNVMLYRLEMGRPFTFDEYDNLYDFWKSKITQQLNSELTKNDFVLNLASAEYFKAIDKKELNAKVIDVQFYEMKTGKPKTIVVYTKHARGLMLRYCAETQAKSLNDLKAFNYGDYLIDEERSTDTQLVFTR